MKRFERQSLPICFSSLRELLYKVWIMIKYSWILLFLVSAGRGAEFTSTSHMGLSSDGSVNIGMETLISRPDPGLQVGAADFTVLVPSASWIELNGTIAFRTQGRADILVRLYLGNRLILNVNMKSDKGGNLWINTPVTITRYPAESMTLHVEAAGNSWPINVEVELAGSWGLSHFRAP